MAGIGTSTASAHLARLKEQKLVTVLAQGKHRYYALGGVEVAAALEALMQVAGLSQPAFVPGTPHRLRNARTCYDHMAGAVGVALHGHMAKQCWLVPLEEDQNGYQLSDGGIAAMEQLGLDLDRIRATRRRFACACLDWSERRPHLGGALGAAIFALLVRRSWVERDLDSRALSITAEGKRALMRHFAFDA